MTKKTWILPLVALACISTMASGQAAPAGYGGEGYHPIDVGISYMATHPLIKGNSGRTAWIKNGGKADVAVGLGIRGLSAAAQVTGGNSSSLISSGLPLGVHVTLGLITMMAGPRYSYDVGRTGFYGEGLFGMGHVFGNNVYNGALNKVPSMNSFAYHLGGGVNIYLSRRLMLRLPEVGVMRTNLGSSSGGTNIFQVGTGILFRLNR